MKSINSFLSCLQQAKYLSFYRNPNGTFVVILEKNALILQSLLLKVWQSNNDEWMHINRPSSYKYYINNDENLRSFTKCRQFHENYKSYHEHVDDGKPAVIKTIGMLKKNISDNFITLKPTTRTLLISDYFVKTSKGLEKFYNLQRKRKIWWMLYAANPSNFSIEALRTSPSEAVIGPNHHSSVAIQVEFPFGAFHVEFLTYVPLKDSHNEFVEPISCIRSSIDLETTTFVMLLNAVVSNRNEVLLLNRKLVPYQCYISHLNKDTQNNTDINELHLHITYMLQRADLRLYSEDIRANSKETLADELQNADRYGIPYTLFIDNESLKTGFLKLRSRDTTLMETVHLSDLPTYLLNILNANFVNC